MQDAPPKKSLGQHWLHDQTALFSIAKAAELTKNDHVLEIGPGLGTLTDVLLESGAAITAVEFDDNLASQLTKRQWSPSNQPTVINQDILKFDLTSMPPDYKVVANIPYYLTSNLLRLLSDSPNQPKVVVLLIQKEVAERVASVPGQHSLLSVMTQLYFTPSLGALVPAKLFTPPPKVDSQVLVLIRRDEPLIPLADIKVWQRIVKAGFSQKRKTLANSLSAGLNLPKNVVIDALHQAKIDPSKRAQALTHEQWYTIAKYLK